MAFGVVASENRLKKCVGEEFLFWPKSEMPCYCCCNCALCGGIVCVLRATRTFTMLLTSASNN